MMWSHLLLQTWCFLDPLTSCLNSLNGQKWSRVRFYCFDWDSDVGRLESWNRAVNDESGIKQVSGRRGSWEEGTETFPFYSGKAIRLIYFMMWNCTTMRKTCSLEQCIYLKTNKQNPPNHHPVNFVGKACHAKLDCRLYLLLIW